ncbi:MAG: glutamate racemase [Leptothrix sp. (in: b-proteobacteria)]
MSSAPSAKRLRIGVFDSGLGGLSVLRAIHAHQADADLLYVADSGFAPYGEKPASCVIDRSLRIARFLRAQGADVLVVACNTATALAIESLRSALPGWPIVGVEPGIKPAAARSRNRRVGVLATEGTLRSERFRLLRQAHAADVELVLQPCPGLAAAIELGELHSPELRAMVAACCAPLRELGVDTVVLGCTHYPFVADVISEAMGGTVTLVDTADAVARQTQWISTGQPGGQREPGPALIATPSAPQLWSTGDATLLSTVARRWLSFDCEVSAISL